MKPEYRSDALDRKLLAVPERVMHNARLLFVLFGVLIALNAAAFTAQFIILHQISADTRRAIETQIPGLEAQIRARDRTIEDNQIIIDQATTAIVQLLDQVKELGGEPPRIILKVPPRKSG